MFKLGVKRLQKVLYYFPGMYHAMWRLIIYLAEEGSMLSEIRLVSRLRHKTPACTELLR